VNRIGAVVLLLVAGALAGGAQELALPNRPASLKFAAVGDNGTGDPPEYDIGRQMAVYHQRFPFELVIMLGDNLYGRQDPQDFVRRLLGPWSSQALRLCCLVRGTASPRGPDESHLIAMDLRRR
jgi:hypothetical protein